MITSVVSSQQIKPEFPKLMSHSDGLIVLFTEKGVGVSVVGDTHSKAGRYSATWNYTHFEDFSGSVTLSNGG